MSDRNTQYFLVQNRKKPKKTRQYRYDDDDDDDDYPRIVRTKPPKERVKYFSSDELDSDYRRQPSDVCVCFINFLKIYIFISSLVKITSTKNINW
jgi:hypothetical protein